MILWESKRTKGWSDGWLAKLREDQRRCGADVALIISHALPKHIEHFDLFDGVWVAHPRCALPVTVVRSARCIFQFYDKRDPELSTACKRLHALRMDGIDTDIGDAGCRQTSVPSPTFHQSIALCCISERSV